MVAEKIRNCKRRSENDFKMKNKNLIGSKNLKYQNGFLTANFVKF